MDLPEKKYTQEASGDGIRSELPLILDTTTDHFQFRDNTAPSTSASNIFLMVLEPPETQRLLIIKTLQSHSDTPQVVGLLRMSDHLDSETSTWQHTTLTRDRHPCPGGIRTGKTSKGAVTDPQTHSLDRTATRVEVFAYTRSNHLHSVHCYLWTS
jgi:hypothetical protein